jgi:hypothetical protein
MNTLQILSLFFNCIISVGSSVLLLYADIGVHRDIKELNVFLASIFIVGSKLSHPADARTK